MRKLLPALVSLTLGLSAATSAHATAKLTVVELFQSQGCSSCPPANANVIALSTEPNVLALSFGVTYWDYLGWKDTFASQQFTARQWDYAHAFRHSEVFTPQVVIDGRQDAVGQDRSELNRLIHAASLASGSPAIALGASSATIGEGPEAAADVWLVRYDPNIVQVPILRGENSGVTLPHKNVVHELVKLGEWNGREKVLALPAAGNVSLRTAVLVQVGRGGPIIAAAHN